MKEKIHHDYKESTIVCVCGEVIHTRSTRQSIKVDICSKCHPFFTGQQKLMDSAGMVEKFNKRYSGKTRAKKQKAETDAQPKQAAQPKPEEQPKAAPADENTVAGEA
ncbi:MAG: 50S ribosomal protein L31 [Candidatus Omnitrophota bacterium]